ncbi:MAG: DUF2769 domain-containing protein [Alphaproteobacteria bacterium]|nr:DUF2769 domain-containing protein [Alphaproteobacteria bacterium]
MRVERNLDNIDKCLCMKCISYTGECKLKNAPENFLKLMENYKLTDHYEKMFCAYGKSQCIELKQGCLCSQCEIYYKYKLQNKYYCLKTGGKTV